MREFGLILTPEQVAAVPIPSKPWIQPTEILPVPTSEEMQSWYPDEADERRIFRSECNVMTGERKTIELTLEEYRARHVNKIISKNEWLLRKQAEDKKAKRAALLEKLLDELEAKEGL